MNTVKQHPQNGTNRSTEALDGLKPVVITEHQPVWSQHDVPLKLKYSLSQVIFFGCICVIGFVLGLAVALTLV